MASDGAGATTIEAVASKEVIAGSMQIMVNYAVGAKAASIGFVNCKCWAGTARKIMCQDV